MRKFLTAAFVSLAWAPFAHALSVGNEGTAIPNLTFESGALKGMQPDGSLSTIRGSSGNYWVFPFWKKGYGEIVHGFSRGATLDQLGSFATVKRKGELFRGTTDRDGTLWILNTYQVPDGVLAFIHVENADRSGGPGDGGKSRVALGWSRDGGSTFQYLGPIIIPFQDPKTHNIQGVPYVVRDGYFHIYFHDTTGLTVARAPVSEVLAAAREGRTSEWMKYAGASAGFTSPGLGGRSAHIGVDGISHSDAACSDFTRKCYLVLTKLNADGSGTWVRLYESSDAVRWSFVRAVVDERNARKRGGYQYATIVDASGADNSQVGRRFFVYATKDHLFDDRSTVRWEIRLDE